MITSTKKESWKTFGFWAIWVGLAFFSVYPTCNWLTSQRTEAYPLFIESELAIPFVPEFFWVYSSMYVLFFTPPFFLRSDQLTRLGKTLVTATIASGIIYIFIPTQLGFERIRPDDPLYNRFFSDMFSLDLPHNLVPSLHVVYSTIIILAILENMRSFVSKSIFLGWLILLCLSTLLVHQHHLLDVITGLFIAVLIRKYYGKGEKYA